MKDKFQILKNVAKECNCEDISLKEYAVKLADDYSKVCKSNFKLQQENQQLKGRINKAIEYIEKCNPDVDLHSMFLNESYISNYGACELLEILKGDKDE